MLTDSAFCSSAMTIAEDSIMAKIVQSPEDYPSEDHYAIVEFSSVHVPGDERSRTHPGHGYPAHDVPTMSYKAYDDQIEWEKEIARLEERKARYKAFSAKPARVSVKTTIRVR